jgi:hypothetical protein
MGRWGGTPLSDARRNNPEAVITLLEAEADRGRHAGFPSANVLAGGPGQLGLGVRPFLGLSQDPQYVIPVIKGTTW